MTTQIFESYGAFLKRTDKTINGVTQAFADANPGWGKDGNNGGYWNCSGCSDYLGCSDCFPDIPIIENIHQKILAAIQDNGNSLNMSEWHTCNTTHCRGGWAVFLAGEKGKELENNTSTLFAAMQIYKASSPIRVYSPRFFETDEIAMKDIIRCAQEEEGLVK
jgi:hypothetical protein